MRELFVNDLDICISDIQVKDYILFEEKKIEPNSRFATGNSVGFNAAMFWLFSNFYQIKNTGEKLTRDTLDKYCFEVHHTLVLINELTRVNGNLTIFDDASEVDESNHFKYKNFEVERIKIPYSETYQFTKGMQHKKENISTLALNKKFLLKYFKVNGEMLSEAHFNDSSLMPVDLFLLLSMRLGKLLQQ